MLRLDQNASNYVLNEKTKVRVKNVPNEREFKTFLTLTYFTKSFKPLEFGSPKEIADFIATLDYDDEQTALPFAEAPNERLISSGFRAEFEELLIDLEDGKTTASAALEQIDLLVADMIGGDDNDTYPFPALWDINQRKNWVNSRNHMRRSMRSDYKG